MNKTIYNGDLLDRCAYSSYKFLSVASCGVHANAKHITVREKGRPDYHLLYVESGEMLCELSGHTEIIREGGYVLYSPYQRQRYEQNGGMCYWVHFSGTAVEEILTDAGLRNRPLYTGTGKPSRTVTRAFERMIYRYITEDRDRSLALSAELLSLLGELCDLQNDKTLTEGDERLRGVILYMHKHYSDPIDLSYYAKTAGLSKGRFAHIFKEVMGISPYAYVLELRLGHAAELLVSTELSITKAAYECGFEDPLYFSRLFKKRYGASPETFRGQKDYSAQRRIRSTGCD